MFLAATAFITPARAADPAQSVLILYDSGTNTANAAFGWYGNLHAKHLANLMGHFDLNYQIEAVEDYQAGDMNQVRATFYIGSLYDNPLPAAFTNDVANATNTICWFRYNLWQVNGDIYFPKPLDAKIGFRFLNLDSSGYSNILYKGESLNKNQLDPELGIVAVLDTNLVSTPAVAWRTNADLTTASTPYITHGSNFWYVADSPFDFIAEEDRYLAFCDLLHDILNIHHAESHQAIIRIEDVSMSVYDPTQVRGVTDVLRSNNVPFCLATIPVYKDPDGYYNSGIPEIHHLSDSTDSVSTDFLASLRYALTNGGQVLMHGYTHQYTNVAAGIRAVPNPYTGVSADDFEFWRETFNTNNPADPYAIGLYAPIDEDSLAWVSNRIQSGIAEFTAAGITPVAWEPPHYAASDLDYRYFATNFALTIQRVLYFADDYTTNNNHVTGQFFPFVINRDTYGQKIIPENLGNYEPTNFLSYPARTTTDIVRAAKKNLVVRDGWASAYFHGFYDTTNLTAMVTGIKALGYTYVQLSPTGKPAITFQPVSQTNQPAGTNFFISVAAVGGAPLSYQWFLNSSNAVTDATNAVLEFSPAQTNQSGNYTVVIANASGAVTSAVAVVDIGQTPTITTQPAAQTNILGNSVTFGVGVGGTSPFGYQWRFNTTNLLASETNSSLTITNTLTNSAGNYSVVVTNRYGAAISADALLTMHFTPVITNQPASQSVNISNSVTFTVGAFGDLPLMYQWRFNTTNLIVNATNTSFTIAVAKIANNGEFTVVISNIYGVTTSAPAVLTVISKPAITSQPVSASIVLSNAATFTVGATGSNPLGYQWLFNNTNSLSGATNTTLTINPTQLANAGDYTVVVSNIYGVVTSAVATLTVHLPAAITNQPASQSVTLTSNATFTVGATGDAPLAYQWLFNSSNVIANATTPSLTITNAQLANAGNYSVVVSNTYGVATSALATLTIKLPPTITNQPASQLAIVGSNPTMSVGATGDAPLTYRWRVGVTNDIANATNSSLTITNAQLTDSSDYVVVVMNPYGVVTSAIATLTIGLPPSITNNPANQSVILSNAATFTVGATGSNPLGYQWLFNSNSIVGATSPSLTISNAQSSDAGNYSIVVSNAFGVTTSVVATLTVNIPPSITSQPTNQLVVLNNNATFAVGANGDAPLSYQWRFNDTNDISGATNFSLTITNAQLTDVGGYSVVVANTYGTVTSLVATLTIGVPPSITTNPASQSVILSNNAAFSVSANGDAPLGYQWLFNSNSIPSATTPSLAVSNAQPANAGSYSVVVSNAFGVVTSAVATLTVNIPPSITNQPASQLLTIGNNANLSVGATGDAPLSYQWRVSVTNDIAGAINSSFTITNAQLSDAADYVVVVSNPYGTLTSSVATLTLGAPPAITNNPVGLTVFAGSNVTFAVGATGSDPLTYQWRFNTTNVSGATTSVLNVNNAQPTNAGNYTVVISNAFGVVTSSIAMLVVHVPPFITTQLTNKSVTLSNNVTFSIIAGGDTPLAYQWWFNASNSIANATNTSLTITNATTNSAGNYAVVVSNPYGAVTSAVAKLTVNLPPLITTNPPATIIALVGSNIVLTAAATGSPTLIYRWKRSGTNVAGLNLIGLTNEALSITNAQTTNSGNYTIVVTNSFGAVTSSVAAVSIGTAPNITTQPSGSSVTAGSSMTVSVVASGSATLTYQWRLNGTNVSGATSATYFNNNPQAANAGYYTCVVTNNYGSVTSSAALVNVSGAPYIFIQPTNINATAGSSNLFVVGAGGTATLRYRWRIGSTNILNATNATLIIPSIQSSNVGNYTVIITNTSGSVTSAVAALTIGIAPVITNQPVGRTVTAGSNVLFSVLAGGTATLRYQWQFNTTNILNATNTSMTVTNAQSTNAGNYTVIVTNAYGAVTSSIAALVVNGLPVITNQPANVAVLAGDTALFTVGATNALTYQWRFGGTNLTGEVGTSLSITNAQTNNVGNYSVVVSNNSGAVTSAVATLTIVAAAFITNQPASLAVIIGSNATFTVGAIGDNPLRYQWRFNATNNLPNATNTSLTITNSQTTNAGDYTVVITNAYGAVTSSVATLAVGLRPTITTQPQPRTNAPGTTADFSVVVAGTAPFTYQWLFNTTNISGANTNSLSVANVSPADVGNYSVTVSNLFGSVTSGNALLTILATPNSPVINLGASGGGFNVSFNSQLGFNYFIEYKDDLGDSAWSQLTNAPGTGAPMTLDVAPSGGGKRFYRVRVQ